MFCCWPSLATPSVCTTPKCCKRFLKLFSCSRGGIANNGQGSHDNGHNIHLKCVLACCSGTVADNFLIWAHLRHAIPSHLKTNSYASSVSPLSPKIKDKVFDVLKKTSKDYYMLLLSKKAQFPNNSRALKRNFDLTEDQLKVFTLPHIVRFQVYIRAFQYKVLKAGFHLNFGEKMDFCFFPKLATITT